jgi:hypothetical protein
MKVVLTQGHSTSGIQVHLLYDRSRDINSLNPEVNLHKKRTSSITVNTQVSIVQSSPQLLLREINHVRRANDNEHINTQCGQN